MYCFKYDGDTYSHYCVVVQDYYDIGESRILAMDAHIEKLEIFHDYVL